LNQLNFKATKQLLAAAQVF